MEIPVWRIVSLNFNSIFKIGISGNLINSNVMSRNNAGCAGYMAPERIDPGKKRTIFIKSSWSCNLLKTF
jgi:hypothetical protein